MTGDCVAPLASVVIPAYNSHDTIAGCLEALARQSFRSFEVLVVDSGPSEATAELVPVRFPEVRYIRSPRRLLPHAARNVGVARAAGSLLVFTDPDIYAEPDWLERLVVGHQRHGDVIVGSLRCFGSRWLDRGLHLCKFGAWLPAGPSRLAHMAPTANMLVSRAQFEAAGGLPDDGMLGDVTLSRNLVARGVRLVFDPRAVVDHHHVQPFRSFVRERYARGQMHGNLRLEWLRRRSWPTLGYVVVTVLPVRFARILMLSAWQAARAGEAASWLAALPIVVVGHAASLAGEARVYASSLVSGLVQPRRGALERPSHSK